MSSARFQFGNIIVVNTDQIGVIVKTWHGKVPYTYNYDVYVRSHNGVRNYEEKDINHFIFSKELTSDELEFYEA